MALAPGTIVVANPGSDGSPNGLFAVDPANGRQTTLAQGGMFVEPWNVVFLADGRLLVSDRAAFGTGGLIAVDPASGQQTKVSSSPVFLQPFGMALAADGQVVVAYLAGNASVLRVDPANGDHRAVAPNFRFDNPFGVALDAAGNVIVTDPDNLVGDPNRLIRVDTGVGASIRADSPGSIYTGVAVEPTGNLIVANNALVTGSQNLLRFHPTSGAPTVLSQGDRIRAPWGVAVEANGAILVIDGASGVIRVNPTTGAQTTVSTGDSLRGAMGVAVRR